MDPRTRTLVTGAVMGGVFLAALDTTIVAAVMPSIARDLGGRDLYAWPFAVYIVASTATVPLYGRLADSTGRLRLYHVAVGLFLLGSLLCGLATSMPSLVAARLVQGLGAGGILPMALTMAGDLYGPEARARVMGRFSSVWALASILGPVVGGGIADGLGWRWVFLLNVPFGAASAAILQKTYVEALPEGNPGRPGVLGAIAFTLSLGALLAGLTGLGKSSLPLTVAGFGVAAALGALFVIVDRKAEHPLLDLGLLKLRMVASSNAVGFFSGGVLFAAAAYVPLWVTRVHDGSSTEAGLSLTPMSLGWLAGAFLVGRAPARLGVRALSVVGLLAIGGAAIALARLDAGSSLLAVRVPMAFAGLGFGLAFTATLVGVQNSVDRARLGQATSSVHFFRSVGGVFGVSIAGALQIAGGESLSSVFLATVFFALAALASGLFLPGVRSPRGERDD